MSDPIIQVLAEGPTVNVTGVPGVQGATGPQGHQGHQGPQGSIGISGLQDETAIDFTLFYNLSK